MTRPRTELTPELELKIAALRLARPSGQGGHMSLVELLRTYPHLADVVLRGICALPDLSIHDALMTLARIALLRVGVRSQNVHSDLARAADELPIWFVREVRRIDNLT